MVKLWAVFQSSDVVEFRKFLEASAALGAEESDA